MKTKKLYFIDQAQFKHTALVTNISEINYNNDIAYAIELNETIFHPQGGGQPSCLGSINDSQVIKVIEEPDTCIKHLLRVKPSFQVGDQVELTIDQNYRELCSKLHTGGHLIAHIVEEYYPELKAVSGHHFPGEAHVLFKVTGGNPDKQQLVTEINNIISSKINAEYAVTPDNSDLIKGIRTISIGSYLATPCGGTHVDNVSCLTGLQVNKVKAKSRNLKLSYDIT